MKSEEIPHDQWQTFLDDLSRRHQGEKISIQLMAPDLGSQVEADQLPLLGITADKKDIRGEVIEVIAGGRPSPDVNHVVERPTHVRVAITDDGSEQAVEIESETQPTVLVSFGPPEMPDIYYGA